MSQARRREEWVVRPCPDCGEHKRPNEPMIVHIPGCRYDLRQTQRQP